MKCYRNFSTEKFEDGFFFLFFFFSKHADWVLLHQGDIGSQSRLLMKDSRGMNTRIGNRRLGSPAVQPQTNHLNSLNPSFCHSKMGEGGMGRMLLALLSS